MTKSKTFAIIGGGIGGLTTAIALQKKGFAVTVFERAPQFLSVGAGIVLAANAIKAYQSIGIENEILAAGKTLDRFSIKDERGRCLSTTDSGKITKKYGLVSTLALHRADLHEVLLSQLRPGTVLTDKALADFSQDERGVTLNFVDGTSANADFIVAADGIHSIFRKKLIPDSKLRYAGQACWRGVTEKVTNDVNPREAVEIWGAGKRFGMVPLTGGRVYWYASVDASASDSTLLALTTSGLRSLFNNFEKVVCDVISGTSDSLMIRNDIYDLKPIARYAFGNIVLLGDAAHATTPNLGQGACMAIEDAAVLAKCLSTEADVKLAFKQFELRRIQRNTRIVNTSYSLGKVAQISNPVLMRLRNAALRVAPESVTERQLKFLYNVSFG